MILIIQVIGFVLRDGTPRCCLFGDLENARVGPQIGVAEQICWKGKDGWNGTYTYWEYTALQVSIEVWRQGG